MRVLALNSGSSSVKCALFEAAGGEPGSPVLKELCVGSVADIGSRATIRFREGERDRREQDGTLTTHEKAVRRLLGLVGNRIDAVGHRIVHGGHRFTETVRIDAEILSRFAELTELAPLHNPVGLAGIREAREILGAGIPMAAVFDTAFHHRMPDYARAYALPQDLTERYHVRRYGFHGLAHGSSAALYAESRGKPFGEVNLVTLHLGNGCSAAAIRGGRSIDTSMGFTPLEGLVMGTRCGDLDPALVGFLADAMALTCTDVERMLNQQSGLLGLSGLSSDMQTLLRAKREGHRGARLAVEAFCYRARKYLGAYLAVMGGHADAVVFSGGIGEHAPEIRSSICSDMELFGLILDQATNEAAVTISAGTIIAISPPEGRCRVFVAGIEEEKTIARETVSCLAR
jgi:acetate kinase